VKRCAQTHHTHAPGNSNYANSVQGLDLVIETMRQLRPHVIWENCENGGCMLTYKMARLYHTSGTVDNIATYATRQGVYGASYPFSPRYSVRYMQDAPTPYTLRSVLFGGPLILMQRITDWTAEQLAMTQTAIAQYKQLRELIRDAKVVHLLPPRTNLDGHGWGWDAIQAVAADQTRSVVLVYRAQGDVARKTIRPRGLRPSATYRVHLTDAGQTLDLTGAALATRGIELTLPEFSSELIAITEARS
jgi:alpha-galactosidase